MDRPDMLKEAIRIVTADRQNNYGTPEDNFSTIAKLWGAYLRTDITPTEVAMMMILLKIARQMSNESYGDNYIDIAGYAACACEIATERSKNE